MLAGSAGVLVRSSEAASGTRALLCASVFDCVAALCTDLHEEEIAEEVDHHQASCEGDGFLGGASFPHTVSQCVKRRKNMNFREKPQRNLNHRGHN